MIRLRDLSRARQAADMTRARKSRERNATRPSIGLLINFVVTPGDVQDRNMIGPLLAIACKRFPLRLRLAIGHKRRKG